jgi:cobalt-zinc-cadmium efflux system membrane fusion protein
MCAEHGLLEAVCTRCNPSLIPVFQARGDWCARHGFPLSLCPTCHPERGGRPATDIADAEEGPADGTKVRLRGIDTARHAGFGYVRAEAGRVVREVSAPAQVAFEVGHVAAVNPRVPGVLRKVLVAVGEGVTAGAPLAELESAGVGVEQSRSKAARSRLAVAQANLRRLESLAEGGVSTERDRLAARSDRDEAAADVMAAEIALEMAGSTVGRGAWSTLTSPIAGRVTQVLGTPGRLVGPEDILLEVVDTATMAVLVDIPETEAARVAVGQPLHLRFEGLPGRTFETAVSSISPAVDVHTRTVRGRASLANKDGMLRSGLYGRAVIEVADPAPAVLVPSEAVQRARKVDVVFVRLGEDVFEARRVTTERLPDGRVAVTGRVQPGDTVVTTGSFLLKTETLKGSIGAGCCEAN